MFCAAGSARSPLEPLPYARSQWAPALRRGVEGIHGLDRDTLTICDNVSNLGEHRLTAFLAKGGSGYLLITFKGAKP
jgi:hypothetical protein